VNRRVRPFAWLAALLLIILAGGGIYAYSLQKILDDTQDSVRALEQDRNMWKAKAEAAEGLIGTASSSLNRCTARVDELQTFLMSPLQRDGARS